MLNMLTCRRMPKIDLALRMLEDLPVLAHKCRASFVPQNGLVLQSVETMQTDVLQICTMQFQNTPYWKQSPNKCGLAEL